MVNRGVMTDVMTDVMKDVMTLLCQTLKCSIHLLFTMFRIEWF
jgi:hypothetical protein